MCQKNDLSHRQCVICNKQLIGRSDKRFCDIKCKNYYHSEVRKSLKTIASETMKVLAKNIIILEGIMGEEKNSCLIDRLALERLGFIFNYVTDVRKIWCYFLWCFQFQLPICEKQTCGNNN